MRSLLLYLFTVIFCTALFAAEKNPQIVCDEDGMCRIVENETPSGTSGDHAAPQVICDEDGVCRIVETENSGQPEVRKLIGMTGKDEFLQFLKNEPAKSVDAAFWGMMLIAFLGGLALNLTPCVLPMLPINLAIIGASGGTRGMLRGILYGAGMAVTYGVLGILAAFAGVSFGSLNSSSLFNFAVALIFLIMALAMAGVFNIDFSGKFRINPGKLNFSKEFAAFLMGGISALLAGACVAPVVISVLLFAAGSGWYGCFVPFALGIGMALPWPLAGAGLAILPKPGKFMAVLKHVFAIIIFAAAVYYIHLGIKLLPQDRVNDGSPDGFTALAEAEELSRQSGKPVLLKFTASWCKNCHAMDNSTLRDPEVAGYIRENFIPVTFPAEDPNEPEVAALLEKYGIPGFPAFVIISPAESAEK